MCAHCFSKPGTHCEQDIDDCAGAPCQNEAQCIDIINGYDCACATGYDGEHCEIDLDECESAPCANSGTCEDGSNSYTWVIENTSCILAVFTWLYCYGDFWMKQTWLTWTSVLHVWAYDLTVYNILLNPTYKNMYLECVNNNICWACNEMWSRFLNKLMFPVPNLNWKLWYAQT